MSSNGVSIFDENADCIRCSYLRKHGGSTDISNYCCTSLSAFRFWSVAATVYRATMPKKDQLIIWRGVIMGLKPDRNRDIEQSTTARDLIYSIPMHSPEWCEDENICYILNSDIWSNVTCKWDFLSLAVCCGFVALQNCASSLKCRLFSAIGCVKFEIARHLR